MTHEKRYWLLLSVAVSLLSGWFCHWKIFEHDLFFYIRAGGEILSTGQFVPEDHWTFTLPNGTRWHNFEWLSSLVYYFLYRIDPSMGVLGWFRPLIVFFWSLLCFEMIRRTQGRFVDRIKTAALLSVTVYFFVIGRFQLRPELLILPLFSGIILIWQNSWSLQVRRLSSLGILLLWSNLHGGTAPVGVGIYFFAQLALCNWKNSKSVRETMLWTLLGGCTWFATPLGFYQIQVIIENAVNNHVALTSNADHFSFNWRKLAFHPDAGLLSFGLQEKLWVIYTLFSGAGLIFLTRTSSPRLPPLYNQWIFSVPLSLGLTLITLHLWRGVVFQSVFLLPIAAATLDELWNRATRSEAIWILILAYLFPVQKDLMPFLSIRGSGLDEFVIPVASAEFIAKENLPREVFNTPGYGGYLAWRNPSIRIFMDGRGISHSYYELYKSFRDATHSAENYQAFLNQYGVKTAVEIIPNPHGNGLGGFEPQTDFFYPPDRWALIFFDNASQVLVKRSEVDPLWLSDHEYKFVKLDYPASYGALGQGLSDSWRRSYELELDRCLRDVPRSVYCLIGKAKYEEMKGNHQNASNLFELVHSISPHLIKIH